MIVLPYPVTGPPGTDAAGLGADLAAIVAAFAVNVRLSAFVDTTTAPVAYVLPKGPLLGDAVLVQDKAGHADTHNVTLSTVDGTLINLAATLVISTAFSRRVLVFNGTGWSA